MPAKIVKDEVIGRKYCAHCLHKENAPVGIKETKEQKKAREERNSQLTLIYEVRRQNGKTVNIFGSAPYFFEGYPYHLECLLAWLRKKYKKDEEKINITYQDCVRRRNEAIDKSRKKGKLTSDDMKKAKPTRKNRENLINYFMGHYGATVISKKVQSLIKDLDEGKSVQYNNLVIHYDKLLDMFLYYEDDLMDIYKSKLKKGKAPSNASQRILYDLSIVILNIDEYNSRKYPRHQQQDQRTEGELLDVTKYIRPVADNSQKEKDKEIEMVNEIVKELEKNDIDDNDYLIDMFFDDLFRD